MAGVACTMPLVWSFHRRRPVRASSAYRLLSYEPKSTRSPVSTGDDLISEVVVYVQSRFPSAVLTAWNTPARSPTKTAPPPTAGDDSPIRLPVAYFQRTCPVERSNAMRSPLPPPTYTTPPAMAADDSMMSPS